MQQQKSTFLKVMSILLIVFGAIALVVDIVSMVSIGTLLSYVESLLGVAIPGVTAIFIFAIISAVLYLVGGIAGLGGSTDPRKAAGCVVWGILMIILGIVSIVITYASGYVAAMAYAGVNAGFSAMNLIGFIVPVLYIVAAFMFAKNRSN